MTPQSLEDEAAGGRQPGRDGAELADRPVRLPGVPAEFSNWRDEQVAWRETCGALRPVAPHDRPLHRRAGRAQAPLRRSASTPSRTSRSSKAKQFVACNHDGYVIGDAILFFLDENRVSLVGRPSAHNWVQYHAETGDYDVTLERDERTAANPTGRRKLYRFQVQGPNAIEVLEKANGGAAARDQVLQHGRDHDRRHEGARAAPRHVGRPRARALRAVGGARGRPRRDRRGRRGLRPAPGRLARLRDEHARVGLDPVPAARGLHGRRDEGVPRVAAGRAATRARARSAAASTPTTIEDYYADAARARLLAVREVRPRLRRARGARGDGRRAAARAR